MHKSHGQAERMYMYMTVWEQDQDVYQLSIVRVQAILMKLNAVKTVKRQCNNAHGHISADHLSF